MLRPNLIEINARMDRFNLRDWILTRYGIDLVLYSLMCCLGIRPIGARQTCSILYIILHIVSVLMLDIHM
jgi:hypothetical protein